MGSKPTSQSNTTQTSAPPSWVTSAYQSTIGQAQNQATTPYTPYTGQLVAPVNSQQTAGINAINSAAGIQNPYNAGASGLYGAGSSTITPSTVGANQIEQYESPYQSQVVNATEAELQNQNQQQSAALTGNTVASGAMGGDRAGVAQAALAGQQDLANNATIASLNNQNYQQALSEANTQQQTGLQAQEQTAANQLTAGAGLGALGNTAQTEALNLGNAQTNAGTLQQTTSQAGDTANYNQYLQQLAYPYQNLSWLSSIEGGLGSLAGGTTTGEQTTSSSSITPYIGAGLGLLSLLARGGRIPTKAGGGGMGGSVTPYSGSGDASITPLMPYSSSQQVAPGSGSYVPGSVQISAGHTMPSGMSSGSAGGQQQQNSLTNMLQTSKSIQGLGSGLSNAFQNSSLGDAFNDFTQDNLGFAKGGRLGLGDIRPRHYDDGGSVSSDDAAVSPEDLVDESLMASTGSAFAKGGRMTLGHLGRRHFDDGGTVTPNDLLFDPNAMGLGAAAQQFSPNASAPQNTAPSTLPIVSPNQTIQASAGPMPQGGTFDRIINQESGGRQFDKSGNPLIGANGEVGMSQIEPATAREAADYAGVPFDPNRLATDPSYNHMLGNAYYQKQLSEFGSPDKAAAAYNAGPGAVSMALAQAEKSGGSYIDYLPASTRQYVANVTGNNSYAGLGAAAQPGSGNGLGGASLPSNTLAFDDSGNPISAGLGAISNALHLGSQPQASPSSPPSDMSNPITNAIGASPQGRSGLLGLDLSDSTRLGLLSAGLGIMGGTSRNPWVNIGQGGLEGIQAMQGASKNAAEVGLERAQTQGVMTDNQIKQMQVQMMLGGLEQMQKLNQQYEAGKGQAPTVGNNVTAPTVTAPTIAPTAASSTGAVPGGASVLPVAGNSAQPSVSADLNAGKQIDREWDPSYLAAAADAYSRMGPQWAQVANTYRQRLTQIGQTGRVMFADGTWGNVPGFVGAEAQKASATTSAQEAAKSQYDLIQVQPEPGAPTYFVPKSQALQIQQQYPQASTVGVGAGSPPGSSMDAVAKANPVVAQQPAFIAERQKQIATDEDSMTQQFETRQLSRQRLQALEGIMQNFQPGAFAEEKAELAASLRGAGINVPDSATVNPAAFEEFTKNAIANVFNDVKGMGGRVLMSEIQGLTKANANPNLQPAAAAAIIGQGLGVIDWEDQHFKDYMAWKDKNPNAYNTSSFEIPWVESHPIEQYVTRATQGISYQGQKVPPASQRTVGQIYMTPKGAYKWAGTGWQPAASQ